MATTKTETKPVVIPSSDSETEETAELTIAEAIAAAVSEEHVRVLIDGTEAKSAEDAAAFLASLTDQGIAAAKKAASAVKALQGKTRDVAAIMLQGRASIILSDGMPDWSGSTETYKKFSEAIVTAAMGPGEGKGIVQTRLNKACQRMLPSVVSAHVVEAEGIDISEDDVARIVAEGAKASEMEDERVKSLVSLVNDQYRTGDKDRPDNWARSPFEAKVPRAGTGLSSGESAGSEAAQGLPSFRAAMKNLTADVWTAELVLILQDAQKVLTSQKPALGDGGRKASADNLFHVGRIALSTGKILSEKALTKEERERMEVSLAFTPSK